ncbi:hypothetical protein [Muricoccus vinaceus]|uniref:DUF222 domain-containing protein n=1 Tax=Muricoccus vinaceus TaxID=424704 RepID=A0ABV6IZW8_9PROT
MTNEMPQVGMPPNAAAPDSSLTGQTVSGIQTEPRVDPSQDVSVELEGEEFPPFADLDLFDTEPPEPPTVVPNLGECPTLDRVVARALERLTQHVPKTLSTDEKLGRANELDAEASVEAGWDNYSTAARLRQFAEAHRLAAVITDWNAPQGPATQARDGLARHLIDVSVLGAEQDDDVGEHTRVHRETMSSAIGEIELPETERIIDELAGIGALGETAVEQLKAWHREEREMAELERWKEMPANDLFYDNLGSIAASTRTDQANLESVIDELAAAGKLGGADPEEVKAWHRAAAAREAEQEAWRSGPDQDNDLGY